MQRTHGFSSSQLHTQVRVYNRRISPLHKKNWLHGIWNQQSIDNKTGSISTFDWHFPNVLHSLIGILKHMRECHWRINNFYERHKLHRVETVNTNKVFRSIGHVCEFGNAEARRIPAFPNPAITNTFLQLDVLPWTGWVVILWEGGGGGGGGEGLFFGWAAFLFRIVHFAASGR
jgi:hypothetical protein